MAPDVTHSLSAFHDEDIIMNILIRKSTFEQSFFGLLEGDTILSDFFKRTFYQTSEIPYLLFHTGEDSVLSELINQAYTGNPLLAADSYVLCSAATLDTTKSSSLGIPQVLTPSPTPRSFP